jgi:hypothetical protein
MNAVLLENVQKKVVRSVLVTRTVLQVFTVARTNTQTEELASAFRTVQLMDPITPAMNLLHRGVLLL